MRATVTLEEGDDEGGHALGAVQRQGTRTLEGPQGEG